MLHWEQDDELQRLRTYLRIPSVHPDVNYEECVDFLKDQASILDLPVVIHEFVSKKPIVVISWLGLEPNMPSILLNSHMDVVPVYEEFWSHPPFDAAISDDGFIYARGVQDMKATGMMHLEAVRRLKAAGVRLKRTVHISFVPDEEIGSTDGMKIFSESEYFKQLNIGFELDESTPCTEPNVLIVFNGERTSRQIEVTCTGEPGHGAFLHYDSAAEKFHNILNKFMSLRAEEKDKVLGPQKAFIGDVTTINLTNISGGVLVNVLPESLSATFDIRIPPDVDHDEFENMITKWCREGGDGISYKYLVKNPQVSSTKTDGCPYWNALIKTTEEMGYKIKCVTCPGATDARFIRRQGIPAINFSPLPDSPVLVHCHDEKLHVDVYKRGIDIMKKVLEAVANV